MSSAACVRRMWTSRVNAPRATRWGPVQWGVAPTMALARRSCAAFATVYAQATRVRSKLGLFALLTQTVVADMPCVTAARTPVTSLLQHWQILPLTTFAQRCVAALCAHAQYEKHFFFSAPYCRESDFPTSLGCGPCWRHRSAASRVLSFVKCTSGLARRAPAAASQTSWLRNQPPVIMWDMLRGSSATHGATHSPTRLMLSCSFSRGAMTLRLQRCGSMCW